MRCEPIECHSAQEVMALARAVRARRRQSMTKEISRIFPQLTGRVVGHFNGLDWAPPNDNAAQVTAGDIKRMVCSRTGFTEADLISERRGQKYSRARYVAVLLMRILTLKSYHEIGRHMRRDHTLALLACRKLEPIRAELQSLKDSGAGLRSLVDAALAAYDREFGRKQRE